MWSKVEIGMDRWQGMFHVFQMIPILPETKHGLKKISNFIANKTDRASRFQSNSSILGIVEGFDGRFYSREGFPLGGDPVFDDQV